MKNAATAPRFVDGVVDAAPLGGNIRARREGEAEGYFLFVVRAVERPPMAATAVLTSAFAV